MHELEQTNAQKPFAHGNGACDDPRCPFAFREKPTSGNSPIAESALNECSPIIGDIAHIRKCNDHHQQLMETANWPRIIGNQLKLQTGHRIISNQLQLQPMKLQTHHR